MLAARLGPAEVRFTGRAEGDLRPRPFGETTEDELSARRSAVTSLPWTWLRQVHGTNVVTVEAPGSAAGSEADAAVATVRAAAVSVATADCAPIVLADADALVDAVAVVHAGWRGLADGVLAGAIATMRSIGVRNPVAALGPCIHPACYQFGEDDLALVVGRLGDRARGITAEGAPALDLPGAVGSVLDSLGVDLSVDVGICTACSDDYYSHRGGGDPERQVTVAWLP